MQLNYEDFQVRITNLQKGAAALIAKLRRYVEHKPTVRPLYDEAVNLGGRIASFVGSYQAQYVRMARELELYDANAFIGQFLAPAETLQSEMAALNKRQATATDGHLVPEAAKIEPPGTGWSWLWWVGGAAALFIGYRVFFSGHGDFIPRQKLPRYAGGTRSS